MKTYKEHKINDEFHENTQVIEKSVFNHPIKTRLYCIAGNFWGALFCEFAYYLHEHIIVHMIGCPSLALSINALNGGYAMDTI